MSRFLLSTMVLLALASVSSLTHAQRRARVTPPPPPPPGVEVRLVPFTGANPPGEPRYLYVMELRSTSWTLPEVVADRRLLRFDVSDPTARHPRPLRCAHPDAPRFHAAPARAQTLGGEGLPSVYREWIDLRMYCNGRALGLLEHGAHVVATYGYAHGARGAWVARRAASGPEAQSVSELSAGEFDVAPLLPPTTSPPTSTEAAQVTLARADSATQAGLGFSVSVRSTSGTRRVYLRNDQVRFRVRGPLGTHECGLDRVPIVPIVDFFRSVSPRAAATVRVDAAQACPDAFPVAGIYEVSPVVELPHAFPAHPEQSLTGSFVGAPAVVRIRVGERGYVEHIPDEEGR